MKRSERKEFKEELRIQAQTMFGQIIAELRRNADLTQEDLAYSCGIDRSFMSKLERGETSVSLITLLRLAKGLETQPSAILQLLEQKIELEDSPANDG
ncbi:MAG: transcriptional regulator [Candidatus Riflebacteria bacterium HGW-Riflebacteria-1]|jgi:transcriptional regulator with XRE-family HTH domain|nr:MAG: transcriptional regulator [Candidatus Riflebacteria bacterium HGW-Riflebacteria-1]